MRTFRAIASLALAAAAIITPGAARASGVHYDRFTVRTYLDGANGGWVTPDGERIIYNRIVAKRSQVFIADFTQPAPTNEQCLTCSVPTGQSWGMEWQSLGQDGWLLFHTDRDHIPLSAGPAGGGPGGDVYALNLADPSTQYRMTTSRRGTTAFGASFSPDGTRVLYTTTTSIRWDVTIASFAVTDGVPHLVPGSARTYRHPSDPDGKAWYETQGWTHDGSHILVTSTVSSSMNTELYLVDVATGTWTRMTDSWAWEEQAEFSPTDDGVFAINSTRDRTDPYNATLFASHALGLPTVLDAGLVAASLGGLLMPHPDYRFAPDIYLYTRAEAGPTRISQDGREGKICVPRSWSADGSMLLFSNQWQDTDATWHAGGVPDHAPVNQFRIRIAQFES